jgi:cyclic beta-1,2-glucan synthetase
MAEPALPQSSERPLRAELFNGEQLQRHAVALAGQHQLDPQGGPNHLLLRLDDNEQILNQAYELVTRAEAEGRRVAPTGEWLLDNFYLIEQQIRVTRLHLPRTYSRELPRMLNGSAAGFPRVYDIALELIAHVDARVDGEHVSNFVTAFQSVTPLTLGELWAVPIMLRLGLIENLRRVSVHIARRRRDRNLANVWATRLLASVEDQPASVLHVLAEMAASEPPFSNQFVEEFCGRMEEQNPALATVQSWEQHRLAEQGLSREHLQRADSQAQAADQVSIGNSITSLRFLSAMDWRKFVETMSSVEQTLLMDPAGVYAQMDFVTRDRYRHCVEELARKSGASEDHVAQAAIHLATQAMKAAATEASSPPATNARTDDATKHSIPLATEPDTATTSEADQDHSMTRSGHVGFYLIDKGRQQLESVVHVPWSFRKTFTRLMRRFPLACYLGPLLVITAVTASLVMVHLFPLGWYDWRLWLLFLLGFIAASQMAISLVNLLVNLLVGPRLLPRLNFSEGIPISNRTMVVIPTLITSPQVVSDLVENLEIRYLGNRDPNLFFALLTDFGDALDPTQPDDTELLRLVRGGIESLNARYSTEDVTVFHLFHRPRVWNPHEHLWMGYERKRGKLEQFNAILRGGSREPFAEIISDWTILPPIQYVITLDTDTSMPHDAARKLIGTMAHPLNRPRFDPPTGRVVEGYAILQPRTPISLLSANRSRFAQLSAGEAGIDPYTREVSDVYQDMFAEGSYVGKGIYDVDAFQKATAGKFPENLILSHDLVESGYARSALVSDVEMHEDHPANFAIEMSRRHRWIRGDWQIAGWLLPRVLGQDRKRRPNTLTALGWWKIFDNLRRSIVPPALLFLLFCGWFMTPEPTSFWTQFVLLLMLLPVLLSSLLELIRKPREQSWSIHLKSSANSIGRQLAEVGLTLCTLPYRAIIHLDAIIDSGVRMMVTRRGLLLWHTPRYAKRNHCSTLADYVREMWVAPLYAMASMAWLVWTNPEELILSGAVLLLWLFSPLVAWWISRPLVTKQPVLSEAQNKFLHGLARETWRYFEELVNEEENWLPPDNIQEVPSFVIATRTSPTNIGMALLANLAAHDFGFISTEQLLDRTDKTLGTMEKLERYRGHLYNWYDTRTLKPLLPLYISSVDSGNLIGALAVLRSGLLELTSGERQIAHLAQRCSELSAMDFSFLYDSDRDLLSIGFNVTDRRRDPSYYDLLASEARIASFILVAQDQLPQDHWFALGRQLTTHHGSMALLSWSGTMFEYLMPLLVMPTFEHTLLDETYRAVVARQIEYGRQRGVPWGISESCFNTTDAHGIFQYNAFGVPGLGYKRGLADDLVIAPYASALALMVAPKAACENLELLVNSGFSGKYGLYEAIDYTPSRVPRGKTSAPLQSYMAHHQGMSLLALDYLLLNQPMQRRFLSDPWFKASELLLCERVPKVALPLQPHAAEVSAARRPNVITASTMRVFPTPHTPTPEVHLLSNGRYHVMATNAGGGYSRWKDLAVTRWREDATCDGWGTFCYLRDTATGVSWSSAYQPTQRISKKYEAIFVQGSAEYRCRDENIDAHTEIAVSPEDDVEVRRVTLMNLASTTRTIELTSYAEVVIAQLNADLAHPAFSNLFVQTEIIPKSQTILCTRRPRAPGEKPPWMFHLMTAQGTPASETSYETDRSKFIGRSRSTANPAALDELGPLSNTDGSVLDPIVAIRRSLVIEPDTSANWHIITGMAETREEAIILIGKYRDPSFAARAFDMAWSHSRVVLRQLQTTEVEAQVYAQLASSMIYANPLHRAGASILTRNRLGQSGLWGFGVSGDLPILLMRIADIHRIELVKQVLQAHAYWRDKGLVTDLVILNEDFSGYRQVLQDRILNLIAAGTEAQQLDKPGGIFIRRSEQLREEDRVLLQTVARVILTDSAETLAEQVERPAPLERKINRLETIRRR